MYKSLSVFVFIGTCLIYNASCQCLGAAPAVAQRVAYGLPNNGAFVNNAAYGNRAVAANGAVLNNAAAYSNAGFGGFGTGELAVIGEMPIAGSTQINGNLPTFGLVKFDGTVPASGVVSISATAQGPCGCNNYNNYY